MAYTANIVKGSADEGILRAKYGDSIGYNYTDRNQFVGSDRNETAAMFDKAIQAAGGSSAKDAENVWGYGGVEINNGYDVSTPRKPAYTPPPAQDNSGMIKQMFDEQKAATVAQLKQAILKSKSQYTDTIASTPGTYDKLRNTVQSNYNNATGAYQSVIDKAPGQYQPLRDQVSAAGYKNLDSLREMLANQGQQGGVNRTEETQVNTATENNINSLNLQQQNTVNDANSAINNLNKDKELKLADLASQQQQVIDQANRAIADLEASGSLQEAQMVAQSASDRIRALIEEGNRVQSTSYQYSQDAVKNAQNDATLTGSYNGSPTFAMRQFLTQNDQWNKSFDATQTQQQWENQFKQAGFDADTAYKMATLAKGGGSRSGSGSGGSGGIGDANTTTINYGKELIAALQSGLDMPTLLEKITQLENSDPRVDGDWLRTVANNVPVDNWQHLPGY